jgi:hypothetical protein
MAVSELLLGMHYGLYNSIWNLFLSHCGPVQAGLYDQWACLAHIFVTSRELWAVSLHQTSISIGSGTAKVLFSHSLIRYGLVDIAMQQIYKYAIQAASPLQVKSCL